ncbi:uncharacterized protein LOC125500341 isoform X2 [Athalia rosae]|uniref:uncharacterized protein LOC125500341 isoform X2 n=1 Tax=Athalia rosae TaxID=37344 RepID=UPI0020346761|nr:uncharacterized protein LOC125500341 isoform X2 [Athalia rosae]
MEMDSVEFTRSRASAYMVLTVPLILQQLYGCRITLHIRYRKVAIKGMPLPGTHRTFGRNRQAPGSKSVEQGIYSVLMGEKIYEDVRGPTTAKFSC